MGEARRRKLAGNMPTGPKPQKNRVQRRRVNRMGYEDYAALAFPMLATLMMRSRRTIVLPKAIESTEILSEAEAE